MSRKASNFSLLRIAFHWLIAIAILSLFLLGEWMEGLDYYHSWYNRAPDWHRSVGMLLLAVVLLRMVWRLAGEKVAALHTHKAWEKLLGRLMHLLLDMFTLLVLLSGYFISTAGGKAVSVFGWFEVPAVFGGIKQQESIAGQWHEWLAIALLVLAGLHAMAALKHHFVDRDDTLRRMIKKIPSGPPL